MAEGMQPMKTTNKKTYKETMIERVIEAEPDAFSKALSRDSLGLKKPMMVPR
jgi:hypothetical protein